MIFSHFQRKCCRRRLQASDQQTLVARLCPLIPLLDEVLKKNVVRVVASLVWIRSFDPAACGSRNLDVRWCRFAFGIALILPRQSSGACHQQRFCGKLRYCCKTTSGTASEHFRVEFKFDVFAQQLKVVVSFCILGRFLFMLIGGAGQAHPT